MRNAAIPLFARIVKCGDTTQTKVVSKYPVLRMFVQKCGKLDKNLGVLRPRPQQRDFDS